MGGDSRAICLGMLQTLPKEQQLRVAHWFQTGGADRDHDWRKFLEHFSAQFEDKQAKQSATEQLIRMRQGSSQFFADFLQDFEYKLQQCEGSGWPDNAKIMHLNAGISSALKTALVVKTLPDNDYEKWVRKVKAVAGRLENLPTFRQTGSSHTKTWYVRQAGATRVPIATSQHAARHVDADGDITMGGINALIAAAVAKALGPRNSASSGSGTRPRAAWKTKEAFQRCRDNNICIRCEQPGHVGRDCPIYRPARNPAQAGGPARVTAASTDVARRNVEEVDSQDESEKGSP